MFKKLICIILSLSMVLSVVPAFAENNEMPELFYIDKYEAFETSNERAFLRKELVDEDCITCYKT